jgi:hypothetical protein
MASMPRTAPSVFQHSTIIGNDQLNRDKIGNITKATLAIKAESSQSCKNN